MVGQAQLGQDAGAERDHLDVGERLGSTQDLDVDLMELAQPPLLRPLVAEHRAAREQPDRQLLAERAGDEGARDAGGVLRAQRQALAASILERVHLLGDDVRGLAERAREHLGELEDRRRDLVVAVARRDLAPGLDHPAMTQRGLAHDVVGAAHGTKSTHAEGYRLKADRPPYSADFKGLRKGSGALALAAEAALDIVLDQRLELLGDARRRAGSSPSRRR